MENGQDSPAAGPVAAAQTHSPRDDELQTPPAPEAVELPSIMDIDRHTLVEVLGASPEGIRDQKSPQPRKTSSVYNGRTAEDDSPLTSADTRETPSPLLLSGDNAFSRQMDDDHDYSDDNDDGNISDATASTVPLSRHSDDDDNALSEAETERSRPRTGAPQLSKTGMVPPPQTVTPRASTPTNGKVTSTAYKRRRVMSPSSPIEDDDQALTSPSQRGSPVYPRKASGRAPSSSLSPVLPSNSLAEMFDEEEPRDQSRQRQPTSIKRDYAHQTPVKKDTTEEVSQLASSSRMDVPVEVKQDRGEPNPTPASAPVSEAASLPPSSLPMADDKPPVLEPVTSQPEAETAPEPAPPPKKRKLDLKKFMAAKLQSPADVTTPNPFEAPAPPTVTPAPPTEEPSPAAKEPVASPFSLGTPAPLPPVASPPPPPPAQGPASEKPAEVAPSPWWTALPSKVRPSFTSFTESRPAIGENSVPSSDSAVALGGTSVPSPAESRSDMPKPVSIVVPVEEPALIASAVTSPAPNTEIKAQAAPETALEVVAERNGSTDLGVEAAKQEPLPGLISPSTWQTKLPATVTSHWSRIPPALEQKDLPPHVDPEARRVDRFGPLSTAIRSPPKASLPLISPQRLPPAGPRASLVPVRPLDYKEGRDPQRDARETERERDLMREREREREVPRGPRMDYRGRGSAVRGSPFAPRGGWHGEAYRGRGRGTGEFRGRGFFPRGRGAFFNGRGRGV